MTSTLIANIGQLVTNDASVGDLSKLGMLRNAAMVVDTDRVVAVISEGQSPPACDDIIDVRGRTVIPAFVDSHNHLVFAGDRSSEFVARMAGHPYEAQGIMTTVAATRSATDDQLLSNVLNLATEAQDQGTGTLETKTGYELTRDGELRSLRIAAGAAETNASISDITLLAAHVPPPEMSADDYVRVIVDELIPLAAKHARWIDAFCEVGAFTIEQSHEVLTAGIRAGMGARIHANQLNNIGAVQLAVELGAASADHCTHLSAADIVALAASDTVATLLPASDFCTRSPYAPARKLLEAGAIVALATNCNPGSSFTTSMSFVIALAVREMQMTCAEALWAATAGGAAALRRADIGNLRVGSRARYAIVDAPSYEYLAYRPGVSLVTGVS
jgi:imidazolonepropionase